MKTVSIFFILSLGFISIEFSNCHHEVKHDDVVYQKISALDFSIHSFSKRSSQLERKKSFFDILGAVGDFGFSKQNEPGDIEERRKVALKYFLAFDKNSDSILHKSEVLEHVRPSVRANVDSWFDEFDFNKNGLIEKNEFDGSLTL